MTRKITELAKQPKSKLVATCEDDLLWGYKTLKREIMTGDTKVQNPELYARMLDVVTKYEAQHAII